MLNEPSSDVRGHADIKCAARSASEYVDKSSHTRVMDGPGAFSLRSLIRRRPREGGDLWTTVDMVDFFNGIVPRMREDDGYLGRR
jgi:hypothetical protein